MPTGIAARLLRDPDQPARRQAWPITGATFILLYKKPQDAATTGEALKFFAWAYAKGGKMAEELDYVPMPAKVVTDIQKMWQSEIKDASGKPLFGRRTETQRSLAALGMAPSLSVTAHPSRPSIGREDARVSEATMNATSAAAIRLAGERAAPAAHQRSRLPRADAGGRHHRAGAAERRHPGAGRRRVAGAQHLRPVASSPPRSGTR